MQAQAYEGYFENGSFFSGGQVVHIPEKMRVYVEIRNESVIEESEAFGKSKDDDREAKSKALLEFFESINACDEEIPDTFPRVNFNREFKL
jgi:hypothetical protein